jgi:peptidoglycan/LPS O-acetylase OafA/YrhL
VKPESKFNNFDLLRILAASQVLVCHSVLHLHLAAPPWLMQLINAFPGVPIFFVISGFLISLSYERSSSLKSYCRNRVLRIYPGLWCCILSTIAVAALCGYSFASGQAALWAGSQLAGAIYTPEFLKSFGVGSYNGSLWTIPVELQFYFILPALYWLTRHGTAQPSRRFGLVWVIFVAIGVAASVLFMPPDGPAGEPTLQKLIRYSFLPHFYLFMSGVMLQRLNAHRSRWIAGKGGWWLVLYLALYYALPQAPLALVPMTLLLGIVTVSMAHTVPGVALKLLRGNDISYGVYIYHGLLVNLIVELRLAGRIDFWLVAAGTYLIGYLSWIAVERPCLRKKKQTISPTLPADKPVGRLATADAA